jgi:group I intron endonuclease
VNSYVMLSKVERHMRKKLCGVYRLESETGSIYIGSSVDVCNRWTNHRHELRSGAHSNTHLQRAWSKYGEKAFSFVILLLCSRHDLHWYEQLVIDGLKARGRRLYNVLPTAGSRAGSAMSAAARAKISSAMKGRVVSAHTRQLISKAKTGVPLNQAHRSRLPWTAERKAKLSVSKMNHAVSPETKEKMKAAWAVNKEARRAALHAGWLKRKAGVR